MLALIPTVGRTPLLGGLVRVLLGDGVRVAVVDASPEPPGKHCRDVAMLCGTNDLCGYYSRPGQNIYAAWNEGIGAGCVSGEQVLILNDDITIEPGSALEVGRMLKDSGFAILGFDSREKEVVDRLDGPGEPRVWEVPGTYDRGHGIPMFAFAVDPMLCARCDESYCWWFGDDDLVYATVGIGGKVGIAHRIHVIHEGGASNEKHPGPDLRPKGWLQHDRELFERKWSGRAVA